MNQYPAWVQPSTEDFCLADGCIRRVDAPEHGAELAAPSPRFAVHETDLCNWHHAQFGRLLGDLVGLLADLSVRVYRKQGGPKDAASGYHGSGTVADAGTWWNPAASIVLWEITDWSRFLVRTVLKEHPLPDAIVRDYPRTDVFWVDDQKVTFRGVHQVVETFTHSLDEDADPRLQLATLQRWYSGWLTAYPILGPALLQDALDYRRNAMRALEATPLRRIQLKNAVCQEPAGEHPLFGDLICGAPLAALIIPAVRDTAGVEHQQSRSKILCTANPHHPQLDRTSWMDAAPRENAR